MRWRDRQAQIEELVYDALSELSEILSIELSCYPEVWWIGKTVKFNDLALPRSLEEEFAIRIASGLSYYLLKQQIIIIGPKSTNHSILEESSHAFHFLSSGVSYKVGNKRRNVKDYMALGVLVELLGMLGARLLGSDWENLYEHLPDLLLLNGKAKEDIRRILLKTLGQDLDFEEFFIYQQGYGLADRIYAKYLRGEIDLAWIRKLFLDDLNGPDRALNAYIKLRNRFWPKENRQVAIKRLVFNFIKLFSQSSALDAHLFCLWYNIVVYYI
ncbi:MAG: hypothetical protein WC668_05005 [Patescibacteria group bacterium]|jgi:hypothetical protein